MQLSVAILLAAAISAQAADYTTYIGDANPYQVSAMATDANGNTYVTGSRVITLSPQGQTTDVFVAKLDSSGNLALLATLSGKGADQANGIALDPSGNIYVAGRTTSTDFPLHHPLQSAVNASGTGFLTKLSADGTVLFSTYLGGTAGYSSLSGVAADSKGDVYVTGETAAADYPHTAGLPAGTVSLVPASIISGAFFAKIASAGDKILYAGVVSTSQHACGTGSTCFTSSISTSGASIAVDQAGNAYIAGNTRGGGLPATAGALRTNGIGAFVAKVNPAGTALVYLTFLGAANYVPGVAPNSSPGNLVRAISADAAGNAYIAGSTSDPAFPATASAFQTALSVPKTYTPDPGLGPPSDAFVAKLNPTGTAMVWATFLGGTGSDGASTIATDPVGNVWTSGTTFSTDFPGPSGSSGQEFLAELNSSGSALSYSALFPANLVAAALSVDQGGVVHASGATGLVSSFTPGLAPGQTSAPRILGTVNAAGGILAGRIAPGELISIYGLNLGPVMPASSAFDAAGFLPTTLAGVQVTINGIAAPLLYVSGTQINAVAPVELVSGSSGLQLTLTQNGAAATNFRVVADIAAPQVFRNSNGSALAINQDGTVNSQTNAAKTGSYVSIWATGTGRFAGADGQMASGPQPFCACQIQGGNAIVSYAGSAPGDVNGVTQINFQVAPTGGANYYNLVVDGKYSDMFQIFVAP